MAALLVGGSNSFVGGANGFVGGYASSVGSINLTSDNSSQNNISASGAISSTANLIGSVVSDSSSTSIAVYNINYNGQVLSNSSLASTFAYTANSIGQSTSNSSLDVKFVYYTHYQGTSQASNAILLSDSLLTNTIDLLYIDASNNTLTTNLISNFIYSLNYNGQVLSNSSLASTFAYNSEFIGTSQSSVLTLPNDFLLSNATDLLYTDGSNNTLITNIIQNSIYNLNYSGQVLSNSSASSSASINYIDFGGQSISNSSASSTFAYKAASVGLSKSDNLLSTTDFILSNESDSLYIDGFNNTLAFVQFGANPNENLSFGVFTYNTSYIGQSLSNSNSTSSVVYNINYTGISQSENLIISNDSLMSNATDSLYVDGFNTTLALTRPSAIAKPSSDSLLINLNDLLYIDASNNTLGIDNQFIISENYATLLAEYFAVGTSTSNSSIFYIAQGAIVDLIGTSEVTTIGNSSAKYLTMYVGTLESTTINNAVGIATLNQIGQSTSDTPTTGISNYLLKSVGILESNTTGDSVLNGIYDAIGYTINSCDATSIGEFDFLGKGRSASTTVVTPAIKELTNQVGNSENVSDIFGYVEYNQLIIGESLSLSDSLSIFNGLYGIVGTSESYSSLDGYTNGSYSINGISYNSSAGLGRVTARFNSNGTSTSNFTIDGRISGRFKGAGLSNSELTAIGYLSAPVIAKGTSLSNTFATSIPLFETYIIGTSTSNTIATAKSYTPVNYTGTSVLYSDLNAFMVAKTRSKGGSISTANAESTFEYSYTAFGISSSVNENVGKFTGMTDISGYSYNINIASGGIQLLGLTTPEEQLALNALLLNSPDRTVNALRNSKSISLDRSDFF